MLDSLAPHRSLRPFTQDHGAAGPMLVAVAPHNAESVLRVARAYTGSASAGVLAVTALEPLPMDPFGSGAPMVPADDELARERFALERLDARTPVSAEMTPAWRIRVLFGSPPRVLTDLARQTNAPLVVVGIGRHRPLDRMLGVETALRVIRRSPCPVLAVAHGASAPMRRVVIATDFSIRSARAAEAVIPLLADDAVLHVLHVVPAWADDERNLSRSPIGSESAFTASWESYERALPERFRRFTDSLGLPSGTVVTHVTRRGNPATEILAFAESVDADLIAAGRHGRGMLASMLAGSVTSAILRGAQRSVLVTPEPSFADVDRLSRLLTGASESSDPKEWTVQLDAFSRRNCGRATIVEEDDRELGAQVLERGYRLLGAAYDPNDQQVELMLGGAHAGDAYMTHHIRDVDFLTVATDPCGRDTGLSVQHGRGQTLLTFECGP